jgi:hypothetical protein
MGNVGEGIIPEVGRGAAGGTHVKDLAGAAGVGSSKPARAFGHEQSRREWVEAGGLEQFRGKVRAAARGANDEDIAAAQHRAAPHVDGQVSADVSLQNKTCVKKPLNRP